MKAEIKAEWVAALRSGEYEQAHHVLRNAETGGYCCLGVLCEIAVKHGVIDEPTETGDAWLYDGCDATPSTKVGEWAGFDWLLFDDDVIVADEEDGYQVTNPKVSVDSARGLTTRDLAALNDSGNYDFNAIADLIEAQL